MIKATLQRNKFSDLVTFGELRFDNGAHPPIFTLELPFLNNIPDKSCIPQGLYNVIPYSSPKHPNVWEVLAVPDRKDILIHIGNYASKVNEHKSDTLGCILVGFGYTPSIPMLTRSTECVQFLRGYLKGMNFSLEISN